MRKKYFIIIIVVAGVFAACNSKRERTPARLQSSQNNKVRVPIPLSNSVAFFRNQITLPQGHDWIDEAQGSYGSYLQSIELKPSGSKILDYTGMPIRNQSEHEAILNVDIGNRDLQQCADAVIRLRAEYLYSQNRHDEIGFHFTSGDLFQWNDYKVGMRQIVSGNDVSFTQSAAPDDSYNSFRKYLDVIFSYAGTISVNRETVAVSSEINTGDILITPGSPGHAVLIIARAKHKKSRDIVYLLAEGYTPAQSIHIVTNPANSSISPWYSFSPGVASITTARYTFSPANIRRYQ